MKIPKNKLPLKISPKHSVYGQYDLSYLTTEDSIPTYKYAGRIAGKELANYMVEAANKFPEVIKLLKGILQYYKLDAEEYSDGEILDLIKPDVEEFIKTLEE